MYYDVVVSIYESEKCNTRTDSELVCGGFETEEEAEEYVRNNEINEYKYTYFLNIDSYCYHQTGISNLELSYNSKIELDDVKKIDCYENILVSKDALSRITASNADMHYTYDSNTLEIFVPGIGVINNEVDVLSLNKDSFSKLVKRMIDSKL